MGQNRRKNDRRSRREREITVVSVIQFLIDRMNKPFKTWRLKRYKRKKVRAEMTLLDKQYMIQFKIMLDDQVNPQQLGDKVYEMVVPAKAAYFAKRKLKSAIQLKIQTEVVDLDVMTSEELAEFKKSRKAFLNNKKDKE